MNANTDPILYGQYTQFACLINIKEEMLLARYDFDRLGIEVPAIKGLFSSL